MLDEILDFKEGNKVPPPVDLNDPQPWFLRFTEPILEEKEDDKPMFTWPLGAPRPLVTKTDVSLQEVLDFICPPFKISEDGDNWRQQVSDEPSNRTYEEFLKDCLDQSLIGVRSRFSGFCPYRNRIYRDMFSEVIRVVAVGMKERGTLLLRVKDEIDTTVDRLNRLYKSSMGYAVRKVLRVEKRKLKLELEIDHMREKCNILNMMSKDFVTKSKAGVEELRYRREHLVKEKNRELEQMKSLTRTIEKTILQFINDSNEKQRKMFLRACLLYDGGTSKVKVEEEEEVDPRFMEVKDPTKSTSALVLRESET